MEANLNYEDELDAARDAVRYAGGAKKVGQLMFPDKSVDAAARYLMDALNPARAERLSPSQVLHLMRLARASGFDGFAHYWMRESGYQAPVPVQPETEAAVLSQKLERHMNEMKSMVSQLQRIQGSV